jgi:phosphatidylglycerol:prolipoprotein diacylglycerol transferase
MPDAQLGYLFGFVTMGQLLSIPLIVAGIIELVLAHRRAWPQRGHVTGWDATTD